MARFRYSMENILQIKIKLEEQEKNNFAIANARLMEEQKKLQDLLVRRANYEKHLKELATGAINVNEIKICKHSIDSMKVLIRNQMMEVSKAQKALEIARKRLNDAMKDRKGHEKLKEKQFQQFLADINYEENKNNDELVSYSYFNRDNYGD